MASVTPIGSSQGADQNNNASQNTTSSADPLANESTFMTLLVSQLQNQDPTNPMDGTTFVTQLAQFSNLQQSLAIRQDTDSLSSKITGISSLTPQPTTDGTQNGSAS